jgi:uncharacterized membrane protein YphA (DoxX/SURF4 family)
METFRELRNRFSDPGVGYDLIRVYLGIGLLIRGALFVTHPDVLMAWVASKNGWFLPMLIAHYVAAAHIVGGILLAVGLRTRLAAAAQIPILLGAVFFVHRAEGLLTAGQSLEFAALVLVMLVTYGIFGSGRVSLDRWLGERQKELEPHPARS